jgi:hypothetical protein
MVEVIEKSELLRRNVICIKKQFLSATSIKKMHWQVIGPSFYRLWVYFSYSETSRNCCKSIISHWSELCKTRNHILLFHISPPNMES